MIYSYITPIMDRTLDDVIYAREHQNDLVNKNKGSWNYTDLNRICNNLKYAAEWMYEQGFLGDQPYSMKLKLDWKETDIITYEQLNSMIVNNLNELKSYSRPDLEWYDITSIANMDYSIANWIERNINALATQVPLPPDTYKLTVKNGFGSGNYEANTVVTIQADTPDVGLIFDYWSGDHLENIGDTTKPVTTYTMPHQDITLEAHYTGTIPHKLTIKTYTKTETLNLLMGEIKYIEADPAPDGKVFHHWQVEPEQYDDGLYEPAASTHFTMPNEEVTLTAVYIDKGQKYLRVINGTPAEGYYDYDTYVSISPDLPENTEFVSWSGDTQYLTADVTSAYNSVKIPDVNRIQVKAEYRRIPATNIKVKIIDGLITDKGQYGETEGVFTEGDRITIAPIVAPQGQIFFRWTQDGPGSFSNANNANTIFYVGANDVTITATYRTPQYHDLTVTTHKGTTTQTLEQYDYFTVDANPAPDNYTFDKWTGDTHSYNNTAWGANYFDINSARTGTCMGTSDRTITATYRPINPHTLTVKQLSGDVTYTQAEFSTLRLTADNAPAGKRFVRWDLSGKGSIPYGQNLQQTIIYTFGNGDATLTPIYVNVWTINVIDGTINGKESTLLDEGERYTIQCRGLLAYEGFDGWTQNGPGEISNIAATRTYFTVGAGNTTLTANIIEYPDKTLTIYERDPDTGADTLVSTQTYRYGSKVQITAPISKDKTTFSSWLGDIDEIRPSVLASTATITLNKDTTIIATYYYPKSPEYYTLTVYGGTPEYGTYPNGSQISVNANPPSQGYEFYNWYGDTQFLVDQDLTKPANAVIIPQRAVTLKTKYNMVGELPLYEVSVTNGRAKATYVDSKGNEHNEGGEEGTTPILVPPGTEVTLIADPPLVGKIFDYWKGNFAQVGVTDIILNKATTKFTMVENDVNATAIDRNLDTCKITSKNATDLGDVLPGEYTIYGTLRDTDDKHYSFQHWICVDIDGNDYMSVLKPTPTPEEPTKAVLTITEGLPDLYIEAVYTTHYKLTVVKGQDTGDGYYYEGEEINSVIADDAVEGYQFDHWEDPVGIITTKDGKYSKQPLIKMKDSIATITAVFTSTDAKGNSVAITGDDLHSGIITRHNTSLINGVFTVGTIVFDKDGCIGIITEVNPDTLNYTDDYKVEKLFYGGNF